MIDMKYIHAHAQKVCEARVKWQQMTAEEKQAYFRQEQEASRRTWEEEKKKAALSDPKSNRGVGASMKRLADLREEYTPFELSYFPGDGELRYRIFSPFYRDLYENKVVYYEKGLVLVKLENIEITPVSFHATAIPYLRIEDQYYGSTHFPDQWGFGTSWEHMCQSGSHFYAPYCSWSVWPEPGIVQAVETLIRDGHLNEALRLTVLDREQ